MASVTLKDVPEELMQRLRQQAASDKRSLNKEALFLLDEAMRGRRDTSVPERIVERVSAQVDAWKRLAGRWYSDESSAHEIENIYAARSEGRDITL